MQSLTGLSRSISVIWVGALLLLSGSRPTLAQGQNNSPDIDVTPAIVDFGEAALGATRRRLVTISNRGNAPLRINPVRLQRGTASPFGTCNLEPEEFLVPIGQTRRLLFCFIPTIGGPAEEILEIHSNDADEPLILVALRGRAPGPPAVIVPPLLRMTSAGNPTGVGGSRFRAGEPVTIRYGTEVDDRVSLRLENGATTVPLLTEQAVRGGQSYTLEVSAPSTPGTWQLALTRVSDAPGRRFGFEVVRGPRLEVTAPAFPEGPAGQALRQTILLRNTGLGTLAVEPPTLLGSACAAFAFCAGAPSALTLPAGGPPVPLEICFAARTAGVFRDTLFLASDDPDQPRRALPLFGQVTGAAPTGTVGIATIALNADPPTTEDDLLLRVSGIDWPNACFPRARTSVTRLGDQILIDTTPGGPGCPALDCEPGRFPWSIAPEPVGPLAEGRYEAIVTYHGQVIGRRPFWVFAANRRPATPPTVSGAAPELEVTPDTLDLGDVVVGATGQQTVTVRNTGEGPLAIGAGRFEGEGRAAFRFCAGASRAFTVAPGQSREILLCFAPTEPCPAEATLVFASNDPDERTVAIPLRGRSSAGAPSFGQLFGGSIRAPGESDTFCVALGPGDQLLARLTRVSGELQPAFSLSEPTGGGRVFWSGGQPFTLPSGAREGLYRITLGSRADGAPSAPGDYNLFLQRLNRPVNATALAPGRAAVGEITRPGEMDTYTVAGNAGETLRLQIIRTAGTFRPAIHLYGPDGILVGQSSQPRGAELVLSEVLPSTGAYIVLIGDGAEDASAGIGTGTYTLTASR